MPPPKKSNGWKNLCLEFDEPDLSLPRKPKKIFENPSIGETIFTKPSSFISTVSRPRENIKSLSALIEACEPMKASDLSVSKQKQKEISEWFAKNGHKGKPKVLVITGPSGCGKTLSLKVIAKEHDYEILEWTTPIDSVAYESFTSQTTGNKFVEFMIRATRYNSLLQSNSKRLLLVKDIPNVYFVKPDRFLTVLEQYFQYGKEPLIFICTDGGSLRVFKTLFPNDVRKKFDIDVINVNAATQTAMKLMLKRVSMILNSRGSHMIHVTQHYIDEVLSNSIGDVRSAVLNLIFCSLKVPNDTLKSDCNSREESLGLLHGIGRVINPKRIVEGNTWKFFHDPDEIASYFQSQSTTFLHFLHENYMNTIGSIGEAETCADIMSLSDTIANEWRDANLTKLNLSYCIRGVMVTNEKPVSGWNPVRKPRTEDAKVQRNLGAAEECWYKSIICPKVPCDVSNLDHTTIEQNSD